MNFETRFWSKVDKSGGPGACWVWAAKSRTRGYGRVFRNGKDEYAHRVAYELAVGPILEGLLVLHSCDNRACCNPAHLRTGTQAENMADKQARGRTASLRGRRNGRAKGHRPSADHKARERVRRSRAKLKQDPVRAEAQRIRDRDKQRRQLGWTAEEIATGRRFDSYLAQSLLSTERSAS